MNVFGKPNEQNQACLSFAMAGKGRKKSNVFGKPNEQKKNIKRKTKRKNPPTLD